MCERLLRLSRRKTFTMRLVFPIHICFDAGLRQRIYPCHIIHRLPIGNVLQDTNISCQRLIELDLSPLPDYFEAVGLKLARSPEHPAQVFPQIIDVGIPPVPWPKEKLLDHWIRDTISCRLPLRRELRQRVDGIPLHQWPDKLSHWYSHFYPVYVIARQVRCLHARINRQLYRVDGTQTIVGQLTVAIGAVLQKLHI